MRILVIDDDPDILGVMKVFLGQGTHHEATCVSSAKAALEAIGEAAEPFECFLVDIQMPEIDGIALTRLIRQTPGYRNTPILMLTAMREKHYLDDAYSAGATDYVSKPFDIADLKRRLQSAQQLSMEKSLDQERPLMAGEFKGMAGDPKGIRLHDPICLTGVGAAIDYKEFENYVRQVRLHRQFRLMTIAVKISHVDHFYTMNTSDAFKSLVRKAATAVEEVLLQEGGVLSYRGNGIFICILKRRLKDRQRVLQKQLNGRFEALHQQIGRMSPRLIAGDFVPLGDASNMEALTALTSAVESVESKDAAQTDIFEVPRRFLRRPRLGDEERHLERRTYETLLRDDPIAPDCDRWSRVLKRREKTLRQS